MPDSVRKSATEVDPVALAALCAKWRIHKLDVGAAAPVYDTGKGTAQEVIVDFDPDEDWSLLALARLERELSELFHRELHIVERRQLDAENASQPTTSALAEAVTLYEV